MKFRPFVPVVLAAMVVAGCVKLEVKPIKITVDVNVKIDRALDDFFGDLDKKSTTITTPAEKTP